MSIFKKKPQSKSYYRNTKAYKRAHRKNYHIPQKILTLLTILIALNMVILVVLSIIAVGYTIVSDASGIPDNVTGGILIGIITDVGLILFQLILEWYFRKTGRIDKKEE